ncbi:hypothetical protein L0F51_08590 [Afifella sp. H1R]|uniref:hypothetical protein n=1 Tax=Afifella sp. H1R TaxID=2908841 RepID=UPI001F3704A3|nr:hypothetical protein [Afifella sp. H1R]MCF1503816.1 hypothetical protein [Afifella sp. H1R]
MMMHALVRLLPDFDEPEAGRNLRKVLPEFPAETPRVEPTLASIFAVKPPKEDPEKALAAARDAGFAGGLAAGRREKESALEEVRASFVAELEQKRADWVAEEAEKVAESIGNAFSELNASLSEAVAAILIPLVGSAIAQQAVADLSDMIIDMRSREDEPVLEVVGPQDLLDAVKGRLGEMANGIDFRMGKGPDVRVTAGPTIIETQLQAWRERVSLAISGAENV